MLHQFAIRRVSKPEDVRFTARDSMCSSPYTAALYLWYVPSNTLPDEDDWQYIRLDYTYDPYIKGAKAAFYQSLRESQEWRPINHWIY